MVVASVNVAACQVLVADEDKPIGTNASAWARVTPGDIVSVKKSP